MDRLSDSTSNLTLSPAVLERTLHATDIMVVVADAQSPDNPIVWVNDYFCEFTGYTRDEVLGRNCRFLQSHDRDQPARHLLRGAVKKGRPIDVDIVNYKKDGTPFYNNVFVSPIREDPNDESSKLLYFVGVQNDVTERVRAKADARDAARRVLEATEAERERFGMDIHDGLGQHMAGISMMLRGLADQLESDGSPHAARAAHLIELLGDAAGAAQAMAYGLNPVMDTPGGLGYALEALCARADAQSDELTVQADLGRFLEEEVEIRPVLSRHLYRIAQEAVANAVKHAEASHVAVSLRQIGKRVYLEVADDGIGVKASAAKSEGGRVGMGLRGMQYRADLVGGTLEVVDRVDGGVAVQCMAPLVWD